MDKATVAPRIFLSVGTASDTIKSRRVFSVEVNILHHRSKYPLHTLNSQNAISHSNSDTPSDSIVYKSLTSTPALHDTEAQPTTYTFNFKYSNIPIRFPIAIKLSSRTTTWEVVEGAIEDIRKTLIEQAECLTAQAATLDALAVQVKKSRDGSQSTESEKSPIDCMNQLATLLNQRMNSIDQGFAEIHTKMLAT